MKRAAGPCNPELVMRYMDGELNVRERAEMGRHLDQCAGCRQIVLEGRRLSALYKKSLDHAVGAAPLDRVENAIFGRVRKETGHAGVETRRFPWKTFFVPAAAVAAVVLFFSFFGPLQKPSEPSAIINSFTAETSSVMILETPETHRTILWFEEKQGQGGENDGMQQA